MLIVGCGCRGESLARALLDGGHAVRGTTRDPRRAAMIETAGAEPFVGDPSRVGTLMPALDGVAIVCLLLGSSKGSPRELAALHGSRLEMLLARILDTAVRGVAYEASGSVDPRVLAAGAARVTRVCERSRIPYATLGGDREIPDALNRGERASDEAWARSVAEKLEGLLAARRAA